MNLTSEGKILLCDFNAASGLSGTLRIILESSLSVHIESLEIRRSAFGGADLMRLVARAKPDLTFLVLTPGALQDSKALFNSIREARSAAPIVIVTDEGEPKELFELLCVGAVDFVTAPLRAREILPRVWRLLEKTRKFHRVAGSNDAERPEALRDLVGQSPMFRAEVEKIPTVARYDCGVLILGETGTGKELVARAIHEVHLRGVSDKARANAPSREQTTTLG